MQRAGHSRRDQSYGVLWHVEELLQLACGGCGPLQHQLSAFWGPQGTINLAFQIPTILAVAIKQNQVYKHTQLTLLNLHVHFLQ